MGWYACVDIKVRDWHSCLWSLWSFDGVCLIHKDTDLCLSCWGPGPIHGLRFVSWYCPADCGLLSGLFWSRLPLKDVDILDCSCKFLGLLDIPDSPVYPFPASPPYYCTGVNIWEVLDSGTGQKVRSQSSLFIERSPSHSHPNRTTVYTTFSGAGPGWMKGRWGLEVPSLGPTH